MSAAAESVLTLDEAVELAAADSIFYSHYFFPNVVRQASPDFHRNIWHAWESPSHRCLNFQLFRGSAKTSIARLFASKRIAYGLSRTILIVGKSQEHAIKSLNWIMQQVQYNPHWANTFGLVKGEKWAETECEIWHSRFKHTVRILALGVTGSVRGINIGGYRPDLIIVDDPCDEENTATAEQRQKMLELVFGALLKSLVPASEDPSAKLALLQTPIDDEDLSAQCAKSDLFFTVSIGILDSEDIQNAESTWPARWTKDEILKDYNAHAAMNQLSLWWREMMCKVTAKELCAFKEEWLVENYWTVLPPAARYVLGIDPAPVLSDKARATNAQTDLQAVMVKCYWQNHRYVVEYTTARDEDPEAVSRSVDRLSRKYPILRCGVEDVAYQRTLKWYLEREMKAGRCRSLHVMEIPSKKLAKDKYSRILQAHAGPASQGLFHSHPDHTEFNDQFSRYPNVKFKDLLDVSAICDATMSPAMIGGRMSDDDVINLDESDWKKLEWERPCP